MSPPAAFRATVHSLRQVPSRKICQLVLELPIEETASVAAIAEHGAWVGIARLQNPEDVKPFPSSGKGRQDMAVSAAPHSIPEGTAPATSGQEREAPSGTTPPAPSQLGYPKERRREFHQLPMPAQAGIRCTDPEYWAFLSEIHNGGERIDADGAEEFVRGYCLVTSRSKILPSTRAAVQWNRLENQFSDWKMREFAKRSGPA